MLPKRDVAGFESPFFSVFPKEGPEVVGFENNDEDDVVVVVVVVLLFELPKPEPPKSEELVVPVLLDLLLLSLLLAPPKLKAGFEFASEPKANAFDEEEGFPAGVVELLLLPKLKIAINMVKFQLQVSTSFKSIGTENKTYVVYFDYLD